MHNHPVLYAVGSSVGNPPFFQDLDWEWELLFSKSGIEIWKTECNNISTGLDCGFEMYLLYVADCGTGI